MSLLRKTIVLYCIFYLSPFAWASEFDSELLSLTNAERAKSGLSALQLSCHLGNAAQKHAEDMATNNYFSHTGLDGSRPWDRTDREGYNSSRVGENIAAGYNSPESTIQTWMNSQGHRDNILNANYTEIGFGYVYDTSSQYRSYWVQVFGTPGNGSSSACSNDTGSNPGNTVLTTQEKATALFDRLELIYPQYLMPPTPTQSSADVVYYRIYGTLAVAVYQENLFLGVNTGLTWDWTVLSTLEEANVNFCASQCW